MRWTKAQLPSWYLLKLTDPLGAVVNLNLLGNLNRLGAIQLVASLAGKAILAPRFKRIVHVPHTLSFFAAQVDRSRGQRVVMKFVANRRQRGPCTKAWGSYVRRSQWVLAARSSGAVAAMSSSIELATNFNSRLTVAQIEADLMRAPSPFATSLPTSGVAGLHCARVVGGPRCTQRPRACSVPATASD